MAEDVARPGTRAGEGYCCKVGRCIETYGLASMDDRLASRWLGTDGERLGLRDLKAFFNRAVLRAAMQAAGLDPLDGEVEEIYRALTDDESGDRDAVRARDRLARAGVDVDAVTGDFVSHPTVGSHLKECLGVEPPRPSGGDALEKAEERVFKLQNRTEAVVRGSIENLRDTGRIEAGEFDIFVSTRVVCERCGTQYEVHDFLGAGGCDCVRDD
ncbi:MAG TPA: hypothetical protein VKA37_07020 [Halobacteriales archaeon]|nr:hypothetical protein [Halobacteriales archaeon]